MANERASAFNVEYRIIPGNTEFIFSPGNQIDYVYEDESFYDCTKVDAYIKIPENDDVVRVAKCLWINTPNNGNGLVKFTFDLSVQTFIISAMRKRERVISVQMETDKYPRAVEALKEYKDLIYTFKKLSLEAPESIADNWDDNLVDMGINLIKEKIPTALGVGIGMHEYESDIVPYFSFHQFKEDI